MQRKKLSAVSSAESCESSRVLELARAEQIGDSAGVHDGLALFATAWGQMLVLREGELQLSRGESPRDTALVLSRMVHAVGIRTGGSDSGGSGCSGSSCSGSSCGGGGCGGGGCGGGCGGS